VSAGSRGADDGLHELAIARFFTPPFAALIVHSQHTNTHRPNSKREGQHLAHVTAASFS
jgi:hypothetical protein